MAVEVAKVELKSVQDASGLEERLGAGQFTADEVVAVVGKTEGNGGVNDFTRLLADQAFRRVLLTHGTRTEAEVAAIPMVWSGGCDGVITPHATVFARNGRTGPPTKSRLAVGAAMSAELKPEDIGRPRMVEIIAEGVRAAMKNAGIEDPADVHYVQTKTPLLTIDWVEDAKRRGQTVACEVHESMGVSNGTTALGIGVALGELHMPRPEQICKDLDLYSSVASCSSGVELIQAQIVLMGNRAGAGGRYRIGHGVMKDALDIDGIYGPSASPDSTCQTGPVRRTFRGAWSTVSSSARPTTAASCEAAARSCSTTRTSTITATPRRRWARSRRRPSAIPPCSSRSMQCTRGHTAAVQ
jgi:barbiturase